MGIARVALFAHVILCGDWCATFLFPLVDQWWGTFLPVPLRGSLSLPCSLSYRLFAFPDRQPDLSVLGLSFQGAMLQFCFEFLPDLPFSLWTGYTLLDLDCLDQTSGDALMEARQ